MMDKVRKSNLIIWGICFVVYQIIAFAIPVNRDGGFWIGYVSITVSLFLHLLCTLTLLGKKDARRRFYGLSQLSISCIGLLVMALTGIGVMTIPGLPDWISVIVCVLVLSVTAVSLLRAQTAAEVVETMDQYVQTQTHFIRGLTADAETLMHRARAPMLKSLCRKVYEAARYSDPMSHPELLGIERQLRWEFDVLTDAVIDENLDSTEDSVRELLTLLKERNNRCRFLK